jgi:transposase
MTTYIGIDVSKHSLDVHISEPKQTSNFGNDQEGIKKLIECIKRNCSNISSIVCEATGKYNRLLVKELQKSQLPVYVAHPNKIRYFAKASGKLAKTDVIVAKVICLYAQHFKLVAKPVSINEDQEQLKALAIRRDQLLSEKLREKIGWKERRTGLS